MSEHSNMRISYTSRGNRRYEIEIWHDDLNQHKVIRGANQQEVKLKAIRKMEQWDQMAERKNNKELASERTKDAQDDLEALENILAYTLNIDDSIDWEALKNYSDYEVPKPVEPTIPQISFISKLIPGLRRKHEVTVKDLEDKFNLALKKWETDSRAYIQERDRENKAIDEKKKRYFNSDPSAIVDYCDMVLSASSYPEYFPQSFDLDYNPENQLLIIDYQLPSIENIPTLKEVRYIQSRNEFAEKHISQSQSNKLYDSVIYQISLRTIHELYEADRLNALASIVFNGYVNTVDPATGHEINPCILSVQASEDEFEGINLANVDPKTCFKSLKGIGSSKLYRLTPIAPILKIDREDARFIQSYAVVDNLHETDNLALMDWEDFEHLVRELFEEEFASGGGEVKVTRASRDGGIDAIAFDPDPIRGGKIAIQAKRYTNTVGVSAVRDLYGTVLNEGATKGILVTTSDYGPDAYEFAKGKPLTLLNGGHLLHLLEKHGHKARIDLKEAKKILSDKD
ncbi:MAG: restriction endonuclease [Anaerolineales bacterium]|jgi:restriction system protein